MTMKLMNNPYATHVDFFQFKGLISSNPKVTPCNLDMIFERKKKFLVGEWKRENESMSQGQGILLKNLANLDAFTVLIIRGNTDEDMEVSKIEQINKDGTVTVVGKSADDLKEYLTLWYDMADN